MIRGHIKSLGLSPKTDRQPVIFARCERKTWMRLDDGAEGNTGEAKANQVRVLENVSERLLDVVWG